MRWWTKAGIRARLVPLERAARGRFPLFERLPSLSRQVETAARIGYGARGFVYVSVGLLTLLAVMDRIGEAAGSTDAILMLARQPFGRVWLTLLGLGLWAFVAWRVLQSVFDADREGVSLKAWGLRAGQATSGLFYGLMAASVFELLDEVGPNLGAEDDAENQDKAQALLALPFGDWLLIAVGLTILGVGVGNIIKGARADFAESLACSPDMCRRVTPIARAGYVARGAAYLPLGVFVVLAGLEARASAVTDFGGSLDALEALPGGDWLLGTTAAGLIAFGLFAFVEARFRRIRAPRDLNPV